jgi:hypothetical protein
MQEGRKGETTALEIKRLDDEDRRRLTIVMRCVFQMDVWGVRCLGGIGGALSDWWDSGGCLELLDSGLHSFPSAVNGARPLCQLHDAKAMSQACRCIFEANDNGQPLKCYRMLFTNYRRVSSRDAS